MDDMRSVDVKGASDTFAYIVPYVFERFADAWQTGGVLGGKLSE